MVCEVHGSDVAVFIDSLKSVLEDVRSVPEERGDDGRPPAMHTDPDLQILMEILLLSTSQLPGFHDN